jgi:hypothetical protein
VLLSNDQVASEIKERFVTSWEMVREVPKVTIDFGNGKKLERTLAGNTVLYVLTPDGDVIDAFPGVYTPDDFLAQIEAIGPDIQRFVAMPRSERSAALAAWHKAVAGAVVAKEIYRTTMAKAYVESPLLKALGGVGVDTPRGERFDDAAGKLIGEPNDAIDRIAARIDDISKKPMAADDVLATAGVAAGGAAADRAAAIVKADSAANVKLLRPAVHLLLSTYLDAQTPSTLKDAIYRKLLRIPLDDPYLGLADTILPGTRGGG